MNWWVEETSDPVHWDVVDGLSILDPKQIGHMVEIATPLVDYGFDERNIEQAFYKFGIDKDLGGGRVRLVRVKDSLLNPSEPLFALPDIVDEERGPYADLVNHLTRARIQMLNDLIEFDHNITIEELEEEVREQQNMDYMEGKAVHAFNELTSILEYVPEGYELELEEETTVGSKSGGEEELEEVFPDLEEEEEIEEDETMKWDEEEESFGAYDEDEEEEDAEDKPKKKQSKKNTQVEKPKKVAKKKATKKAANKTAPKKKEPANKKTKAKKK